ncbi:unnamed protein product [Pylaiella littoralis]
MLGSYSVLQKGTLLCMKSFSARHRSTWTPTRAHPLSRRSRAWRRIREMPLATSMGTPPTSCTPNLRLARQQNVWGTSSSPGKKVGLRRSFRGKTSQMRKVVLPCPAKASTASSPKSGGLLVCPLWHPGSGCSTRRTSSTDAPSLKHRKTMVERSRSTS